MDPLYQQLRDENEDLHRALATVERHLEVALAEKESINVLYNDFHGHYERMKQDCGMYQKRLAEEIQARKELELGQDQRIGDMRRAIEQKQREIEQMQAKMTLPIDSDILRMKIQKDIEGRHRVELEQKQQENDRLSESYYESKRQLDISRTQYETLKYENEKEINDMKEKHRQEIHEMMIELSALQSKVDDKRDRELIRQLRRDLDENKRRTTDLLSETGDLRRERDLLKLDKNELMIQYTKDLEEERNQKRGLQSDIDRLEFKLSCANEENQKLQLKIEKRAQEVLQTQNERNMLTHQLREKEQLIDTLNKVAAQCKEDVKAKDFEMATLVKRVTEEERERQAQDRKEKSKLQRDFEGLEKQHADLEYQRKHDLQTAQSEFERVQKEYRILQEERKMMTQKMQEIQSEHEQMKEQYLRRNEECEVTERELRKLQDKYRDAINNEYALSTAKDHLEASLRVAQDEVQSFNHQYEESITQWKRERNDLQGKIQELITSNERYRAETGRNLTSYKSKYQDYKAKLKKANQNLQTLAARVAKYELQMAAEREGANREEFKDGGARYPNRFGDDEQVLHMMHDIVHNPNGLNEEIRKLLEENNRALH